MLVQVLLSATALHSYVTALQQLFTQVNTPISQSYGGHLQYLTVLGLCTSAIQQTVYLLSELTRLRTLVWLQDQLLKLSAPLEVLISAMYWPIKLTNPGLLLDPKVNVVIDPLLDKKLHLYPTIMQVAFVVALPKKIWRGDSLVGPTVLFGGFATAYYTWITHTHAINGYYPYPMLGLMSTEQRIAFFGAVALVGVLILRALQYVQHRQNPERL